MHAWHRLSFVASMIGPVAPRCVVVLILVQVRVLKLGTLIGALESELLLLRPAVTLSKHGMRLVLVNQWITARQVLERSFPIPQDSCRPGARFVIFVTRNWSGCLD